MIEIRNEAKGHKHVVPNDCEDSEQQEDHQDGNLLFVSLEEWLHRGEDREGRSK